jgi:hypothetical protein
MSSMNTMKNLFNSGINMEFIKYMKCAGALLSPNDMIKYSYSSYLVEKAELGMSCHTQFRERGNEAFIRVPRMFKSHVQ